jgi:hypothetical protein
MLDVGMCTSPLSGSVAMGRHSGFGVADALPIPNAVVAHRADVETARGVRHPNHGAFRVLDASAPRGLQTEKGPDRGRRSDRADSD